MAAVELIEKPVAFAQAEQYNDIQADFDAYWKSSPIYLCDLSWEANGFIKENLKNRIERWREMAEVSPQAAFLLAECYWGKLKEISVPKMLELYRFASNGGLPQAQIRCGEIFLYGFGLSRKYPERAQPEFDAATKQGLGEMADAIACQSVHAKVTRRIFKGFIEEDFYYGMTEAEVEKKLLGWIWTEAMNTPEMLVGGNGKLRKELIGYEKPFERTVSDRVVLCRWKTLSDMSVGGMRIHFSDGKASYIYPIGIDARIPENPYISQILP
jgi:hypothetical protein